MRAWRSSFVARGSSLGARTLALGVGPLAIVIGILQTLSYGHRLSAPTGAHLIVAGTGPAVTPAQLGRDRRVVLVVVDGLGADAALRLAATARLQAQGSCLRMDVGPLTRSRPVYALLSSGVEAARSGVRGNEMHTPAPVESIWEVARAQGLQVAGRSTVAWWRELFPRGFDHYRVARETTNLFAGPGRRGDLELIHPGYVDDAGHAAGAASRLYGQALRRFDGEMLPFLATLDLRHDVVVMTADHGHTDRGGHGSDAAQLRTVLTCAAGRGIAHTPANVDAVVDARALPVLLAMLTGVPLPRHLAVDPQDLGPLFALVDPSVFPPGHLARYHDELASRFAATRSELGSELHMANASWDNLARREGRAHQRQFWVYSAIALLALLTWVAGSTRSLRGTVMTTSWIALIFAADYLLTRLVRGSFDLAAVNTAFFFAASQSLTLGMLLPAAGAVHLVVLRNAHRLLGDGVVLAVAAALLGGAHVAGFGWPLAFPLPASAFLFLPYPLAALTMATGVALTVGALWCCINSGSRVATAASLATACSRARSTFRFPRWPGRGRSERRPPPMDRTGWSGS